MRYDSIAKPLTTILRITMKHKISITILFVFIILGSIYSQNVYRIIESGRQLISLDTITPLPELIQKLESPWSLVGTGKQYWIGYTDDMFSIARYKQIAINPLIEFIKETDSYRAKTGALYALHLIGTDCKVTGRFTEKFIDSTARNAILSFLDLPELHGRVLLLLGRDPWTTDIPIFMNYLSNPENDYNYMLASLQRYDVKNKPVGQELDNVLIGKEIELITTRQSEHQDIQELRTLQLALGDSIKIDEAILNSKEWFLGLEQLENEPISTKYLPATWVLESATGSFLADSYYCWNRSRYYYVYDGNIIIVYGHIKTRDIWLKWWELKNNKNGS